MARDESVRVSLIRDMLSKVDKNKFMSSAYMMSLAGGRSYTEIPDMAEQSCMPMGSMLKA